MKAYVFCFIFTVLFTYLAEINFKKENKRKAIIFSVIAIFIPTFICGIRAVGVGRDIDVYVTPFFDYAKNVDFSTYINSYYFKMSETGYMFFVYLIAKIPNTTFNYILFLLQLVPMISVYFFAYYYRKEIPMWLVVITYLLTWYCRSFTVMRQSFAIGLIILSIFTFIKGKKKKTVILFVIAYLFHKSVFAALGIYLVIWMVNTNKISLKIKIVISFIAFVLCILVTLFYKNIINFLVYDVSILTHRFAEYTDTELSETIVIAGSEMIFKLFYLIMGGLYCLILSKRKEKDKNFIIFYILYIISMILYIVNFKITIAERIGYYYYYPALLYITPSLVKMVKRDKLNKFCMSTILVGFLLVFWIYKYPISKYNETYPYNTQIIRFLN